MMVRLTLALLLPIVSSQVMAETWIKDGQGCQVRDPNPKPDESVTWSGVCRDGYAEGPGVLQWTVEGQLSSRFEGDFAHGVQSGKGIAAFANGNRYEGDFVDGKMSGKGTFTWKNGNRYEGDFVENKKTGKGILTSPNGGRYEGDFLDDYMTGKGVLTGPNGYRWEGEMLAGKQVKTYSSSGKRASYSIKEVYTGSNIAHRDISGISVPPNKTYSQLTSEEKETIKSQYFSMADADEPPYPINGLQSLLEATRDLQKQLRVSGTLSVFVDIDAKGKATAVEVEKSPDVQMLKAVAAVLMLQKYKPAVCGGTPCNMQFPFRMVFKNEL